MAAACVNTFPNNLGENSQTNSSRSVLADLVIRAEAALFSLVPVQRPPAALGLFAAPADHIHHPDILVRRTEPNDDSQHTIHKIQNKNK